MATEIRVPTLGESVSEATVGTWFKKVGDAIKVDEPILELETDKVTIEVPAPVAGTLSEIVAQAGETVGLGALLGQITAGGAAAAPAPAAAAAAPAPAAAAPVAAPVVAAPASSMPPAPAAAKLLAENNISADQVDGSGKRGQVLKGDAIAAVAKAA
ncbi:MAG: E3 binding domain-containing protein, partial [Rhizobiaceae bacterium]|nr:E3 binding domain-containing protein [Rhizobiaceae bacterium]